MIYKLYAYDVVTQRFYYVSLSIVTTVKYLFGSIIGHHITLPKALSNLHLHYQAYDHRVID
jgi:hypothetical protein